ncbi:MAG: radical SAM protein, partial [bacterium]|nr:radical SAM protein [bacterium]
LYDPGTNKILECRREIYHLLGALLNENVDNAAGAFIDRYGENLFLAAAQEIAEAVKEEKILRLKKATRFGLSDHFGNFGEILDSEVHSVTLEVTEACNLRCAYCPYSESFKGKRNHGKKEMSLDTAKKAIRFLKAHSSDSDYVSLGLYGGEPILRPAFVRECTEYAKEILGDRKLLFNMTTNATLVTPGMAEYLLENDFSILISLDGPAPFHNRHRKDKGGNGSYELVVRGLKVLAGKYGEIKKGRISINAVYTPPYSAEKLDMIYNHFKELEWLPDVNVTITYPTEGSITPDLVSERDLIQDKDIMQWALEKYGTAFQKSPGMVKGAVEKKFAKFMQRPISIEPANAFHLNGCCIPGTKKNFVTVDGTIHICEKMPTAAPGIGHVDKGYDLETIKKVYVDEYAEKSLSDCSRCWGIRLCSACYVSAFNEDGQFDLEQKRRFCSTKLQSLERSLGDFSELLDQNPGGLDYLYQYGLR